MPTDARPDLSIVVPLRDEALNVEPLHRELATVLGSARLEYELILVDDGSEDETYARLRAIQAGDDRVRVIRFTRNFGQTAAFAAGFAAARGRFIVTLDGDLQNDPGDIPRLVRLAESHDVVCGWRKDRKDAFLTRYVPSVVANWLIGVVTGIAIHDYGCSMKVFRAAVVKPLQLRPGMHRYLPALASTVGGRVTETVVNHRARRHGHSKYGLSRTFSVAVDLFRLRRLMRESVAPSGVPVPLYEIADEHPATTSLPMAGKGARGTAVESVTGSDTRPGVPGPLPLH